MGRAAEPPITDRPRHEDPHVQPRDGPPVRCPHARSVPLVHRRRGADAGPRHGRQHGDLQRREQRAASVAALSRARRGGLGRRVAEPELHRTHRLQRLDHDSAGGRPSAAGEGGRHHRRLLEGIPCSSRDRQADRAGGPRGGWAGGRRVAGGLLAQRAVGSPPGRGGPGGRGGAASGDRRRPFRSGLPLRRRVVAARLSHLHESDSSQLAGRRTARAGSHPGDGRPGAGRDHTGRGGRRASRSRLPGRRRPGAAAEGAARRVGPPAVAAAPRCRGPGAAGRLHQPGQHPPRPRRDPPTGDGHPSVHGGGPGQASASAPDREPGAGRAGRRRRSGPRGGAGPHAAEPRDGQPAAPGRNLHRPRGPCLHGGGGHRHGPGLRVATGVSALWCGRDTGAQGRRPRRDPGRWPRGVDRSRGL